MNKSEIYTHSVLTFAFTNDGRIITRKDRDGKIDTLPWPFLGYCERNSKIDYDASIWVMNDMDDYKEKIATFFAYHSKSTRSSILNEFLIGDGDLLIDVGELYEKIADNQIEEMRTLSVPSYIRVNNELYDGGKQAEQQIINRIETRYFAS